MITQNAQRVELDPQARELKSRCLESTMTTESPNEHLQTPTVVLCPGQGAQAVGMGKAWAEKLPAARAIFDAADTILGDRLGKPLSQLCFDGPAEELNKTDISQPAIYTCSVACWHGLQEREDWQGLPVAMAGLSLGEYSALHLAGVFDFETGLKLVVERGRLMQDAAEHSEGSMVAVIGASEEEAEAICESADGDWVLVCANFNAPGQIVLSGQADACERAAEVATDRGFRAAPLTVAGAFHSPLMQPAADAMANVLSDATFNPPSMPVWSNVTGEMHDLNNMELLRQRLVEQIVQPVRWSQGCSNLITTCSEPNLASIIKLQESQLDSPPAPMTTHAVEYHELAPGSVLRGLMRRIDRSVKVTSHDEP